MGCSGSKADDLPLVTLCRERKEYIKAAAEQRYALASAHVSYFRSLNDVGGALRRFVDEELVIGIGSTPGSPVLTLPSDEGKIKRPKKKDNNNNNSNKSSSSSTSISHSVSFSHNHSQDEEVKEDDSHLHLSSDSDSDLGISSPGHIHIQDSPVMEKPFSYSSSPMGWSPPGINNSYSYYMKRSSTAIPSVIYEEPQTSTASNGQRPDSSYPYSNYSQYGNGGFFGFSLASPPDPYYNRQPSPQAGPPSPPPPNVSAWDFLNPFDSIDNAYSGYYSQSRYGFGSTTSSPDSKEVRAREGIPDLEEETEQEVFTEVPKNKKKVHEDVNPNKKFGEGTSRVLPLQRNENKQSAHGKEVKSSSDTIESKSSPNSSEAKSSPDIVLSNSKEEVYAKKKGVSFEVEEASGDDGQSTKLSGLTTLSNHGTRDLQEVVNEIKAEFELASGYGKEIAVLLEVARLPYQPTRFKVLFSRILYYLVPSMSSSRHASRRSPQSAFNTMGTAKAYNDDLSKGFNMKRNSLSSTLEKLYVWEKKLYKEVKEEERLRVIYEKQCKKLKALDDSGAESTKIDATQASIRKLLTKLDVGIRAVDAISSRIHQLRDEELQPQLSELVNEFIRMWKSMLKSHRRQFRAIVESKTRNLRANTRFRGDSTVRTTIELEMELLNWCTRFSEWVNTQKSYVESLNKWLMHCLLHEPVETPDGIMPFSPSRIGAPTVFIISNDWNQAMERISETTVVEAMTEFVSNLHRLWERQDEEQKHRLKAEYLTKDFEKRLRTLRKEMGRLEKDHSETLSEKTAASIVPSESGVSPLDDLKVDLDSMRKRLDEERARHKESVKLVHSAASNSIQAGLIPIFEALENFTSEAVKAHEQVRVKGTVGDGS